MQSSAPLAPARRKITPTLAVAIAFIIVAVVYLAYSAAQSAAVYYLTIEELADQSAELAGRAVRVQGRIADGSIRQDETRLWIDFELTDGARSFPVSYRGTPPDLLGYSDEQKYQEVVVEGRWQNDHLEASNLLVQHGPEFTAVDELSAVGDP